MANWPAPEARRDDLAEAVAASEIALRQARDLYAQGLTGFLDVLDAERTLLDNRQDLAEARADVALLIADLYTALGAPFTCREAPVPCRGVWTRASWRALVRRRVRHTGGVRPRGEKRCHGGGLSGLVSADPSGLPPKRGLGSG